MYFDAELAAGKSGLFRRHFYVFFVSLFKLDSCEIFILVIVTYSHCDRINTHTRTHTNTHTLTTQVPRYLQ